MNEDDVSMGMDMDMAKTISLLLNMILDKSLEDGYSRELIVALEYHVGRVAYLSDDPADTAASMAKSIEFYAKSMDMVWQQHCASCESCRKKSKTEGKPLSVPVDTALFSNNRCTH